MYVLLLAKQSITTKEPDLEFSHTFPLHNQDTRWMQDSLLLSIFKFCLQTSLSNWQSRNSPITTHVLVIKLTGQVNSGLVR